MNEPMTTTIDLDGVEARQQGIVCIGKANLVAGKWRVLANVHGALCVIEVSLNPDPRQWHWDH